MTCAWVVGRTVDVTKSSLCCQDRYHVLDLWKVLSHISTCVLPGEPKERTLSADSLVKWLHVWRLRAQVTSGSCFFLFLLFSASCLIFNESYKIICRVWNQMIHVFKYQSRRRYFVFCLINLIHPPGSFFHMLWLEYCSLKLGGAVASLSVCSTPDRVARVRVLAGDIVLCSWARHFTLTVLSPPSCINGYRRKCWG